MEKLKSKKGNLKRMFHTSGTKHGSYSVGMTVLVVAVMIVFNLVVGQIPEAYRNIDVSSTKIYDISDTSKDLLKGLDDKIDMKVLAVKDETDDRITTFISKYAALSDKIKVEWIDPVLHPSALHRIRSMYPARQQESRQPFLLIRSWYQILLLITIQVHRVIPPLMVRDSSAVQ